MNEGMAEAIDAISKVSEIFLQRDTHKGSFLVVEGEHDEEFYANLISEKDCKIVYCLGKEMVKEVVARLLDGPFRVPQVIGIIDADYDRVREHAPKRYQNIFRTDTHDLETMIIRSRAFMKLMNMYLDKRKIQDFQKRRGLNLKELLLREGTAIGCLFIVKVPRQNGLYLKNLEIEVFLDKQNLEVNLDKLADYVIRRSPDCRIDRMTLVSELKRLIAGGIDPWQMCNGHHLVGILTIGIREVFGKPAGYNVSIGRLELELKLAYEKVHFRSTVLCKEIMDWENNNAPFRVLDESLRT